MFVGSIMQGEIDFRVLTAGSDCGCGSDSRNCYILNGHLGLD